MKKWYDGYHLDDYDIYNPKSVVEAITRRRVGNYWTKTSSIEAIKNYLKFKDNNLYSELLDLYNGKSERVSIDRFDNDITEINSKDAALTVLIHLGYLTYERNKFSCRIPNLEIKNEFSNTLKGITDSAYSPIIKSSEEASKAIYENRVEVINKSLDDNHQLFTTIYTKNNEDVLSLLTVLTFLPLSETHYVLKEASTISGRADIVFIPKGIDPAIIIELKVNKEASGAIKQIKEKKYLDILGSYKGKVLLVGINYDEAYNHQTIIEEIEV